VEEFVQCIVNQTIRGRRALLQNDHIPSFDPPEGTMEGAWISQRQEHYTKAPGPVDDRPERDLASTVSRTYGQAIRVCAICLDAHLLAACRQLEPGTGDCGLWERQRSTTCQLLRAPLENMENPSESVGVGSLFVARPSDPLFNEVVVHSKALKCSLRYTKGWRCEQHRLAYAHSQRTCDLKQSFEARTPKASRLISLDLLFMQA
jgi:hypothetical protein